MSSWRDERSRAYSPAERGQLAVPEGSNLTLATMAAHIEARKRAEANADSVRHELNDLRARLLTTQDKLAQAYRSYSKAASRHDERERYLEEAVRASHRENSRLRAKVREMELDI